MRIIQRHILLSPVGLAVFSLGVHAATLPYQGLATDATGRPKADSTYSVVFALYGKASFDPGNTAVWWETQPVPLKKGLFSVQLGSQTALPDSVFHRDSLFLKVQFSGELGFFVPLQAAPWAVYARSVRGLDSLAAVVKADHESLASFTANVRQLLTTFAGVTRVADSIYFDHVNVNVRNGLGRTDSVNGLGNLIVGYNKPRGDTTDHRTGSHTLVIGDQQSFTSYGGILVGFRNTVSAPWASISGGTYGVASGLAASVSGGNSNTASESGSSVSGGVGNNASGVAAWVGGGLDNSAQGRYSTVSGGYYNNASGYSASISGGDHNVASGQASSVHGNSYETVSTQDGFAP